MTPVLFVVDGSIEQATGGYVYDRRVARGLETAGAEVTVLGLEGGASALVRENGRVAECIGRHLASNGVVVVDELCHPRLVAAALARRRAIAPRGRFVTLVHHLAASERRGLARVARLAVERPLLAASDRVVVTSTTTRDVVVGAGIALERVFVVPPGRDRLGEAARPPAPAPDGALRLLFVGALAARKDPLALLEALARLPHHVRATLAGPADREPRVAAEVLARAARLGDRVRVLGEISDAELARLYAEHDALVLPSRYEGFGIVIAEAMAHGLAIVATRAGAIAEVAGHAGLLVAPGDAGALRDALDPLARDPSRLSELQRASLARARTLPTWAEVERAFAEAVLGAAQARARTAAT